MKIIKVDNYDREGPGFDPVLICNNVCDFYADLIADLLNQRYNPTGDLEDFFKKVPDTYILTKWEP
jgi:hypothetical protein